jgi:hypothetical protein
MCIVLILCNTAWGAPIAGLFNTGVDGGGALLGDATADPHFAILGGGQAVTVSGGSIPATWLPNGPDSRWIWQQSNGQPTNVTLTFRTTFDLTGLDPGTAVVTGQWATDNVGDDILINGMSTTQTSGGFGSFTAFMINSNFVFGINTLDFVVRDFGAIAGFRAEFLSASADPASITAIPEPGTIATLTAGLIGLLLTLGVNPLGDTSSSRVSRMCAENPRERIVAKMRTGSKSK